MNDILNAVLHTITKPSTSFEKISENQHHYYASAVVIFVISCILTFSISIGEDIMLLGNDQHHGIPVMSHVMQLSQAILQNIVMIVAVFFIGKKFGGSHNFKKIFSVFSYCLIPTIIAALVLPMMLSLASTSLFPVGGDGSVNIDSDLSPSYALDFASSMMISNAFVIFFGAWIMILYVKATKIANRFESRKSILVVISAIVSMYVATILFGFVTSSLFLLVVPS